MTIYEIIVAIGDVPWWVVPAILGAPWALFLLSTILTALFGR